MRVEVRETVRVRFGGRCGYCSVHESETGALLTVDHFQPVSHGGTDDIENLVYACHACNLFKSDYWETDSTRTLLHPLRDDLTVHLVESITHQLVSLTERGSTYITVLHLNRPGTVERRRLNHRQTITTLILTERLERFTRLEAEITRLQERLDG